MIYCSVCGACSCGTKITIVDGKKYCNKHLPSQKNNTNVIKTDDQVLTPQQKILLYGKLNT